MAEKCLKSLVLKAQSGNINAMEQLVKLFEPLIKKKSITNGALDEDCFQELNITFVECTRKFKLRHDLNINSYMHLV